MISRKFRVGVSSWGEGLRSVNSAKRTPLYSCCFVSEAGVEYVALIYILNIRCLYYFVCMKYLLSFYMMSSHMISWLDTKSPLKAL